MSTAVALITASVVCVLAYLAFNRYQRQNVAPQLTAGRFLPDITLRDDQGEPVTWQDLSGKPAVVIFLRGSWCPFCNSQVKDLTNHYREINATGAGLVFVTPKPLDTTRRVAEIFDVDFTFWIDENLAMAKALGIHATDEVPKDLREKFGSDTVKPTSVIIDANGMIAYATTSNDVRARPEPELLLGELRKLSVGEN